MLTKTDLEQIGNVVDKSLNDRIGPILDEKLGPILDEKLKPIRKDIVNIHKDLIKTERSLRDEILRVEERVENLEEGQTTVKKTLNKISVQLDGFVGRVDDLTNDNEVGADQIHNLSETVEEHNKRIAKLESKN